MAGRVIQGFFVGGRMHPMPGIAPARSLQRAAAPSRLPGPPRPAFAPSAQPVQRHGGNGNFEVDPIQLGLARSGGRPLPQPVLAKMEAAFGADFSAVRVHVGPQAARIGAVAFTTGNDIYFAPGRFQPDSVQGQQLLGHELAHVIQQRQGRVRTAGSGVAVVQDHALEAEADRLGARAAMHRAAPVQAKMARGAGVHVPGAGGAGRGSQRITAGPGGSVGSLMVHTSRGGAAEVTDLHVGAHFRDQGIGRDLLRSAAQAGLRAGNSKLSLSAQDNGSGRLTRWYKDMGFRQIGVNGRGFPLLEAPISRLLGNPVQRKVAGVIQRADAERKGGGAADKDYTNVFVAWLKENDNTKNGCNFSVGRTTAGNYIVSKVGGVTARSKIIKDFIDAFDGKIGDAKVYAAKKFAGGADSGNHAEMCVAAANNMEAGKLEKIICTDPNCDLCAQQLKDMKIAGGSITKGDPGSQQTWCHPTKKVFFGTQYGEVKMATIAEALHEFNENGTEPPASCGTLVPSPPGGSIDRIL